MSKLLCSSRVLCHYVVFIVLLLLFVNQCLCHQSTGSRKATATRNNENLAKSQRAVEHKAVKRELPRQPAKRSNTVHHVQIQQNQTRTKRQSRPEMFPPGVNSIANQFTGENPLANQFPPGSQLMTNQVPSPGSAQQFASNVPPSSASLNSDDEIRHKLLLTLENRLQERNMLLHDNEILREKEFLREKEMNSLLNSHSSFFSNVENPLLAGDSGYRDSRKSLIENNGLFARPRESLMNGLDSSLLNGHAGNRMDGSPLGSSSHMAERLLAARNEMTPSGVGSLGDETVPYGSLGLAKSDYIPVGRVDDNQVRSHVILCQKIWKNTIAYIKARCAFSPWKNKQNVTVCGGEIFILLCMYTILFIFC